MVWTNLDNPSSPSKAYVFLANHFAEQYDNSLIDHMKAMIGNHGFKVSLHGIWHWRNKAWGEPCEMYFAATTTPIPSRILKEKLTDAYECLCQIFGPNSTGRMDILPWGTSTEEMNNALKELDFVLGMDIIVWRKQPSIGGHCVDLSLIHI